MLRNIVFFFSSQEIWVCSHSYWLAIFCTTNGSLQLTRESLQSFENLKEEHNFSWTAYSKKFFHWIFLAGVQLRGGGAVGASPLLHFIQWLLKEAQHIYNWTKAISPHFKSLIMKPLFILILYSWPLADEVTWPSIWERVQYIMETKQLSGKRDKYRV